MSGLAIGRNAAGCWYVVDYSVLWRPRGRSCSQFYATVEEAEHVRAWLIERKREYPSLAKFEGGALWPVKTGVPMIE